MIAGHAVFTATQRILGQRLAAPRRRSSSRFLAGHGMHQTQLFGIVPRSGTHVTAQLGIVVDNFETLLVVQNLAQFHLVAGRGILSHSGQQSAVVAGKIAVILFEEGHQFDLGIFASYRYVAFFAAKGRRRLIQLIRQVLGREPLKGGTPRRTAVRPHVQGKQVATIGSNLGKMFGFTAAAAVSPDQFHPLLQGVNLPRHVEFDVRRAVLSVGMRNGHAHLDQTVPLHNVVNVEYQRRHFGPA
mmetsp:Transcript_5754/g.16146  ORF Transcript_5754/g.16146 Transcript_5754/m.16146 type:complete len:243 (-) Transcript_5754:1095-1823(-)